MPRFVVLHHDWPVPHYDLLLEADGVLKAWRLAAEPLGPVAAKPSFDHRLHYLIYEGELSGDRGCVTRWDHGTFTWIDDATFELDGQRLQGVFRIQNGLLSPLYWPPATRH